MVEAFSDGERRRFLAERGRYEIGASPDAVTARLAAWIAADPDAFVTALAQHPGDLRRAYGAVSTAPFPGRSEALLTVARALGRSMPASEYALPEDHLDALIARARASRGRRVPVRGAPGHKGRVGDGVERLLVGGKVRGMNADHPAAEIKSVPVRGDQVIERVKLGVVSPRSNPLDKCARVLFVFVEQRGADHFVRGHHLDEFDPPRWQTMWRDGFLVETSAGSPQHPARGLYLTPKWFRNQGIWPAAG